MSDSFVLDAVSWNVNLVSESSPRHYVGCIVASYGGYSAYYGGIQVGWYETRRAAKATLVKRWTENNDG